MTDEFAFDTTIIVYAYDKAEEEKRAKCLSLLERIFDGESNGVVTNQILAETYYVLTQKVSNPISAEDARIIVSGIVNSNNWIKLDYNSMSVAKATKISSDLKIPFWDALIAITLIENGVFRIYTENEKDFQKIPGLKVINPIK